MLKIQILSKYSKFICFEFAIITDDSQWNVDYCQHALKMNQMTVEDYLSVELVCIMNSNHIGFCGVQICLCQFWSIVFQRFYRYNLFFWLLVADSVIAKHVFDFCYNTRRADIFSCSNDTFLNPLVY